MVYPVLHVAREVVTVWAGSPDRALRWVDKPQIYKESRPEKVRGDNKFKIRERLFAIILL
jgi:hypothetical protein